MNVQTLILAMGIPSAVTGFCFWLIQRNLNQRQKEHDEQERYRDELLYLLIKSTNASIDLSEAIAKAVQRIPDAHCNGDMDKALTYASNVKHDQKDFLTKQGIKNVLDL